MNKPVDHIQHNIDLLRLDPEDEITCAQMYTLRNQYQCVDYMRSYAKALLAKMLARYESRCIDYRPEDYVFELESYSVEEIDAEKFKQKISQPVMPPFVIKGFFKDSESVNSWTLNYFAQHYADAQVAYLIEHADGHLSEVLEGRIADAVKMMSDDNPDKVYVHNTSQIFKDYPQLLDDIGYQNVKQYYEPLAMNAIVQLFMGGAGTGVRMHCANEFNSFFMVQGNKHWTFIPPEFTYALSPVLSSNGLNALCGIDKHNQAFEKLEEINPLYNRIPKYYALLESGDMLVFGPWWWHAVSNTTPTSIAVASRWTAIKPGTFPRGNYIFGNIQRSNPFFNQYSKKFLASVLNEELIGDKDLLRDTFGRYHGDLYEDKDE